MTLRQCLVIFSLFSAALIYYSCDDAGVVVKDEQFCISGQISNYNLGAKTLHAYLRNASGSAFSIASCPVDASGNFNLCLPSLAPDSALYTGDSIFYIGCDSGNVIFNPNNVRGTEIINFRILDSNNINVSYLRRNNYDSLYPGAFSIMYIYTNVNVTVTGQEYCNFDTLTFNGSAVSPWTKVVKHCTRVAGPGTSYYYDTNEPGGAIWELY